MDRRNTQFLIVGFGLVPLALGFDLPSIGIDTDLVVKGVGLVAVIVALIRDRPGNVNTWPLLRWIVGLAFVAYVCEMVEPWLTKFWLRTGIAYTAFAIGAISYLLITRGGHDIARHRDDASLKRRWQACAWVGLPLFLLPNLFFWGAWAVAGFPESIKLNSNNLFVLIIGTLSLTLPAVLLLHALLGTCKTVKKATGVPVGRSLRLAAHPITAVLAVIPFLAPSLMLVPGAIHFATTPNFKEFIDRNRSEFEFDVPPGLHVLERNLGLALTRGRWMDMAEESLEKKSERIGYRFHIELKRPDTSLLTMDQRLNVKIDPETYDEFVGFHVTGDIETMDPRFRVRMIVLLDESANLSNDAERNIPTLNFMVLIALLAGPGENRTSILVVDNLDAMPFPPMPLNDQTLSYVWQARGKLALVSRCRGERCLAPRVAHDQQHRFDVSTDEYSYEMEAIFTITRSSRGPGNQAEFAEKHDIDRQSRSISWNDVAW